MRAKIGSRLLRGIKPEATRYDVFDEDLRGFVLRVEPSGAKTYYVKFRLISGEQRMQKIGSASVLTCEQARDMAKAVLALASQGKDPVEAKRKARAHTLKSFLDEEYEPWILAHKRGGVKTLGRIRADFPELLNKRLHEITAWQVEKWRAKVIEAGHKATANRDLTYLKACLQRAVEWKHLDANPLANMKRVKEDSKAKIRYLTGDEEAALFAALDARQERQRAERDRYNAWCRARERGELPDLRVVEFTDHLKPMVLLSLNTGMRRGEVFNLRWSDIDFTSGALTVAGATAKSGTSRHVPMNQTVIDTLQAWRRQTTGTDLVFPGRDGKPFDNVNTAWAASLKEASIQNFRWHDMRHHFASRLVMSGVDLYVVSRLLGHSSFQMTQRYAHLAPKIMQDAVDRLIPRSNVISLEKPPRMAQAARKSVR